MKPKLIAMIMVLLLAATPYAPMGYAAEGADYGDFDGDIDYSIEVYEEIKTAAEARRDELLYLLELGLPPELLEKLEEALYAMDEAEEMVDTREATEQYLYALKQFRNTWQRYLSYSPEAAKESLEEIDESDRPSPEESKPPGGLEEEIRVTKEKRLVNIQEEIHERITAMGGHVDDLKGYLSEGDCRLLEHALEKDAEKLEQIKDKVSKGDYDEAIDELMANEFEIENDVDEMDDKEAAETLKKLERLQAQKTKKKQKDAPDEDDEMEAVNEELEKIKEEFKENAEKSRNPDTDEKKKGKGNNGKSSNNGKNDEQSNNGKNG